MVVEDVISIVVQSEIVSLAALATSEVEFTKL